MVPFNAPGVIGRELQYLREAAQSRHLAGDGPFTKRCEERLKGVLGASRVLLTTSCTHALEMAALLLRVGPGDEVILPSFTFVSTANAFVLRGATPVFADVRLDTLNIDEAALPSLITPRTRAIVVVHYAGIGCAMDRIMAIATTHGIAVVEDNAHGLFGTFAGRPLGSFGALSTMSFHDTKNFTCGEGGALAVNDPVLVERSEILREKGTNRSRFFRGEVDKYTWMDLGSSYVPAEMLSAFLLGQLEEHERIQSARERIFRRYAAELAAWAAAQGVTLPHVPANCQPAWHLFYVRLPGLDARQRFIAHMKARGSHCLFHYLPLNASPMGQQCGGRAGSCPVSERASDELARLPFFTAMTEGDQSQVIEAALAFRA
jgi:dTDP-4-amino-4,6-dideoxygalactose transaminase